MFVLQRRLIQDFLLKRSSKEKKYHFTWILKRFMVSKNFHVTSFQYWCHVLQIYQTFQIFGKIITRCRLIECQISLWKWWQWCRWHRYVDDFMMVTDLTCWWQNQWQRIKKQMNGDVTIVTSPTRIKLVSKDMLKYISLVKFTFVHIARNSAQY